MAVCLADNDFHSFSSPIQSIKKPLERHLSNGF